MAQVTIHPDGITITAAEDETLLRALGRAGLRTGSAANAAAAASASSSSLAGEVRYERPIADSVLSDDERVEGICLSCRAVPLTNVVIELQEGDRLRRVLGLRHLIHRRRVTVSSKSAVIRLGYVHLRVTDLEEARNHYSNTLGMEVVH